QRRYRTVAGSSRCSCARSVASEPAVASRPRMRVATSPGSTSTPGKRNTETSRSVSSDSRTRLPISLTICTAWSPVLPDPSLTRRGRAGLLHALPRAGDVFEVQVEVLRVRGVAAAALAQRQDLMDEHRDDDAALVRQQLAGGLVKLGALRRVDRGIGLRQQVVIVLPLRCLFFC